MLVPKTTPTFSLLVSETSGNLTGGSSTLWYLFKWAPPLMTGSFRIGEFLMVQAKMGEIICRLWYFILWRIQTQRTSFMMNVSLKRICFNVLTNIHFSCIVIFNVSFVVLFCMEYGVFLKIYYHFFYLRLVG